MKKASHIFKIIIIAAVLFVTLVFSFQNLDIVSVRFFNQPELRIPLFIIVFGVLSLGVLVGYLLGLISGSKISKKKLGEINISANEKITEETHRIKAELEQKQAKEKQEALKQDALK